MFYINLCVYIYIAKSIYVLSQNELQLRKDHVATDKCNNISCMKHRDGTKTSELCNRLILLDHNKINLVLIFYAL
jgi:hypothetical protein